MNLSALVLACLCVVPVVLGCDKKYYVTILTGLQDTAGTDDWVDIKVLMDNGQSQWHNLDSVANDFQPGKANTFTIGVCPEGKLNGWIIRLNNYWAATYRSSPNWFMEYMFVTRAGGETLSCYFGEWVSSNDYSACLQHNVAEWTAKLKSEGYFEGDRRLYAIRPAGDWYKGNPRCYYWSNGKVVSEERNKTICRRDI